MRAWALLSKAEGRSWESNQGYPDVLGSQYAYDSGVANHRQVQVGDVVVLRDSDVVHGVSRIDRIDSEEGTKARLSCPRCHKTGFIRRKKSVPEFLCRHESCRHEFDEPRSQDVPVRLFVASYGAHWEPLDGALSYADVEPLLDRARQNAIRGCDLEQLENLLVRVSIDVPAEPVSRPSPPAGGHRRALVKVRKGQAAFRQALLHEYGLVCAITGPCPASALEAAHLREFAKHESHDFSDGILLRADIHGLFDAGLIAVDTSTMRVVIAPPLEKYPHYKALEGTAVPRGVYVDGLAAHHAQAASAWVSR